MVWGLVVDLLFPPTCIFCRQPLLPEERDDFLCAPCRKKGPFFVEPGCPLCAGRPGHSFCCRQEPRRSFSFSGTTALGLYANDLKECLHSLKYGGCSYLAKSLGQLLVRSVLQQKDWPQITAVVPIPLHPQRLRERGYNQSCLLARQLAISLQVPLADVMERQRNTPQQTKLSRTERLTNMKGAFRLKSSSPFSLPDSVVLLVDDIFTTGSTLEEAASLLISHGTSQVYNSVVAR